MGAQHLTDTYKSYGIPDELVPSLIAAYKSRAESCDQWNLNGQTARNTVPTIKAY